MTQRIDKALIAEQNKNLIPALQDDYDALANKLARQGVDIEAITEKAQTFQIAIPSWGNRYWRNAFCAFPWLGEPRNIWEKLEDSAVINDLSQCTERVSPHFPLG